MLNVMEERDIQIRGYVLRLPLDVLVVASANPEDYTNRGRIITPLKDRFGAEIRTHYPLELEDEIAVIRQEAHLVGRRPGRPAGDPGPLHPRPARVLGGQPALGVSARFAIAGAETIAAAAPHRAARQGRGRGGRPARRPRGGGRRARRQDRVRVRRGGPRGRDPRAPAAHRHRRDRARALRAASTSARWSTPSTDGTIVTTGEQVTAGEFLAGLPALGDSELYDAIATRFGADGRRPSAPAAIELALEGLYLARDRARTPAAGRRSTAERRTVRHGRSARYGRYAGGPDPLAPPVDLAEALDAIGRGRDGRLLPRARPARVPAPGRPDETGLDDLARRVARAPRDLLSRHRLDGTLRGGQATARPGGARAERKQLARDTRWTTTTAPSARCGWRTCRRPPPPPSTS